MKKFFVLYSNPGGYTYACLRSLAEDHGVCIRAITYGNAADAPYVFENHPFEVPPAPRADFANAREIVDHVLEFSPDAVYVSGWMDKDYLRAARMLRKEGVVVIAGIDTQWKGGFRQMLATLVSPMYLRNAFDVLWGAGERQRQFAWRLGYRGDRYLDGVYCCDWNKFAYAPTDAEQAERKGFLFVGRYVEAKDLDTLVAAYTQYRSSCEGDPWELFCAGQGELEGKLRGKEGIRDLGFMQPDEIASVMQRCGAFVLASKHEPWGLVVQESAAASLPLVCSDVVGASVHLLQDNYNGYTFQSGDAGELADRMQKIAGMNRNDRCKMGRRSFALSKQYLPGRWAASLVGAVDRAMGSRSC